MEQLYFMTTFHNFTFKKKLVELQKCLNLSILKRMSMMYVCTCMYIYVYICICICMHIYIVYVYIYLKHKFDQGMRELNKYKKKKFVKVKSQVEVLAFGVYVFES